MPEPGFKEWFIGEKAKALAMVLLTRRDDLEIRETKAENGLDYTVRIKSEEGAGPRAFGILIRATMSPATIEQANAQMRPTMGGLVATQVLMPVCVFYFTVKDDRGYYTWAHEPVLEKGQARLRARREPDCRPLDDESLEQILSLVGNWYDALSASLKV
jgi:hypothetical protein